MTDAPQRTYLLQIEVSLATRKRLDLVKTIIKMQREDMYAPTWADAVQWLSETVPIPELLADLCKPADNEGTKGD
jgi:hypothetical protein